MQKRELMSEFINSDTLFFSEEVIACTIIGYDNTKSVWQKKITCVRMLHITIQTMQYS